MIIDLLFIKHVGDPEHSLPLLYLNRVQTKPRTTFMKTDTVRQTNRCSNQKERRLGVRCPLKEERLYPY